MVYIKEAHPSDGWAVAGNERMGINIKDPKTFGERVKVAEKACSTLKISMPCLVDGIDDSANKAYAAWPDRLYVVDQDGKIVVMAGPGPAGFAPSIPQARAWLEKLPPPAGAQGRAK